MLSRCIHLFQSQLQKLYFCSACEVKFLHFDMGIPSSLLSSEKMQRELKLLSSVRCARVCVVLMHGNSGGNYLRAGHVKS